MAKNRDDQVKLVESESLSEELSDDGSTEGSESDAEIPMISVNSGNMPEVDSSSSEEEDDEEVEEGSETESDSESEGRGIALPLSPNPTKSKPKKHDDEPATPTISKPVSLKRPPADLKESAAKKAKQTEQPEAENSEKKQLFQRLWSEGDEIAVLKGMIEYAAKKKADPVADLNSFHEFIKNSIHVDVSRTQLQDKIRRLKRKFENNRSKEKDGKNRTFSKAHEQEAYNLSKKIWDGAGKLILANGGGASTKKKSSKAAAVEAAETRVASEPRNGYFPEVVGAVEERIRTIGADAFEGGKAGGEAAKEWKKLEIREFELYKAQLEVKKAQADMVLDFLKSS